MSSLTIQKYNRRIAVFEYPVNFFVKNFNPATCVLKTLTPLQLQLLQLDWGYSKP